MTITLAVEDALSEFVAKRLLSDYLPGAAIRETLGHQGVGFLRRRMRDLNQIALLSESGSSFGLIWIHRRTVLEPTGLAQLIGELPHSTSLLIRIAVMEVESWILADRRGIAGWLGVAASIVPTSSENLHDPKRTLVEIARRSRSRALREAIAPQSIRGTGRAGPAYNDSLGEFVTQHWNPEAARRNAPSLDRAIARIAGTCSALTLRRPSQVGPPRRQRLV